MIRFLVCIKRYKIPAAAFSWWIYIKLDTTSEAHHQTEADKKENDYCQGYSRGESLLLIFFLCVVGLKCCETEMLVKLLLVAAITVTAVYG